MNFVEEMGWQVLGIFLLYLKAITGLNPENSALFLPRRVRMHNFRLQTPLVEHSSLQHSSRKDAVVNQWLSLLMSSFCSFSLLPLKAVQLTWKSGSQLPERLTPRGLGQGCVPGFNLSLSACLLAGVQAKIYSAWWVEELCLQHSWNCDTAPVEHRPSSWLCEKYCTAYPPGMKLFLGDGSSLSESRDI